MFFHHQAVNCREPVRGSPAEPWWISG